VSGALIAVGGDHSVPPERLEGKGSDPVSGFHEVRISQHCEAAEGSASQSGRKIVERN
jgi:hypothetical protein